MSPKNTGCAPLIHKSLIDNVPENLMIKGKCFNGKVKMPKIVKKEDLGEFYRIYLIPKEE